MDFVALYIRVQREFLSKESSGVFWVMNNMSFKLPRVLLPLTVSLGLSMATLLMFAPVNVQAQQTMVRGLPDFTELVEQVGPSVVNIRTLERVRSPSAAGGGPRGAPGSSARWSDRWSQRSWSQPPPG